MTCHPIIAGHCRCRQLWLLAVLLVLAVSARAETLKSQLENLARENGIAVEGLDKIGAESARPVEGDAAKKLQSLLSDYNFLTVGRGGKIDKLTITSLKRPFPRSRVSGSVKTQRVGAHHRIDALLTGPNDTEIGARLLVDTGATTLVLPESMIPSLGFTAERLQTGVSQTAAGSIAVKIGLLNVVKVGDLSAENVLVSFVPDKQLGGARLLGMSFLNRFRFSLDDENSELLLTPK